MSGIAKSARARVLGIDTQFEDFNLGQAQSLPIRVVILAQGLTSATYDKIKTLINSANDAGDKYGYGSPAHLSALQFFPDNGDGIQGIPVSIIGMSDAATAAIAAGAITAVGTATAAGVIEIKIGGITTGQFAYSVGDDADTIAALIKTQIAAEPNMPAIGGTVATGSLPLTAKWGGESGNGISIQIEATADTGVTFSSTAFSGGLVNPDIDDYLSEIGDVWEPIILNALNYSDTSTLGKAEVWNEGRWNQLIRRPAVFAYGSNDNFATRTAITGAAARNNQRTNFLIQSTGSKELPFVDAARGLVKDIAQTANDKPAKGYKGVLTGLVAGANSDQEDYTTKDNAVKLGASTNDKQGENAVLADIVTTYIGNKAEYRRVRDIIVLMNIIYNLDIVYEGVSTSPIAPDETATADPDAIKPSGILTIMANLADSLSGGRVLFIVSPEFTKANMTANIDDQNSERINGIFPFKISSANQILSIEAKWGKYYGN